MTLSEQPSHVRKSMKIGLQGLLDICDVASSCFERRDFLGHAAFPWGDRLSSMMEAFKQVELEIKEGYRYNNVKPHAAAKKDALFAVLLQRFPHNDSEELIRFKERFRVWLIIKALDLAVRHSNYKDENVLEIAWFLSKWVKEHTVGWSIIDRIAYDTLIYHGETELGVWIFERSVILAISRIDREEVTKQELSFLEALEALLKGESKPLPQFGDSQDVYFPITVSEQNWRDTKTEMTEDPQPSVHLDGDDSLIIEHPDEDTTFEVQRLTGRSLLRLTAEEHHYLPYSWNNLSQREVAALKEWIVSMLASDSHTEALGGALTAIALLTANTLPFVLEIPLAPQALGWYLNLNDGQLQRAVPRYKNAWRPSEAVSDWVHASESAHRLRLSPSLHVRLMKAYEHVTHENLDTVRLADLWHTTGSSKLESWFIKSMRDCEPRITSSMIAKVLPYEVFQQTGSVVLARLFNAHPQTTLTGSAAYVTAMPGRVDEWLSESGLTQFANFDFSDRAQFVLGSQLILLPEKIKLCVKQAIARLERLRHGNPIDFHNAFTAYCVNLLMAATGARPINDPFESLRDFALDEGLVLIEDKTGQGQDIRAVPLVGVAQLQVRDHYLPHLRALSKSVENLLPALAQQIQSVLSGSKTAELPLFFFLESNGAVRSFSFSDTVFTSLFDWPLPANLFRHHFIQHLFKESVDPEVIEGWAGHSENGVSSYSDVSERCWQTDATHYAEPLKRCLSKLGFNEVEGWREPVDLELKGAASIRPLGVFGRALRAKERASRLDAVLAQVDQTMDLYFETQPEPLEEESVRLLSSEILGISINTPMARPHDWHRYDRMIQRLQRYADEHDQRVPRLRYGRYRFQKEKTWVRSSSAHSLRLFEPLKAAVLELLKLPNYAPEMVGGGTAAVFGALLLCFENRLTYQRLLDDIVAIKNFRLIRVVGGFYIEYAEALDSQTLFHPVQRHAISPLTAAYLNRALSFKNQRRGDGYRILKPILAEYFPSVGAKNGIKVFSSLVRDVNGLTFTGFLASALDGRTLTTSLPLQDWYRFISGKRLDLVACDNGVNTDVCATSLDDDLQIEAQKPSDKPRLETQCSLISSVFDPVVRLDAPASKGLPAADAEAYMTALRKLVRDYDGGKGGSRKRLRNDITALNLQYMSAVNATVLGVGRWIEYRIAEGHKRRASKILQPKSIQNYLYAIGVVVAVGYNRDIEYLDAEEITELYEDFLTEKDETSENLTYFKNLLVDYHTFMTETLAIEQPDWSALNVSSLTRGVSPGAIRVEDYKVVFKRLLRREGFEQRERDFLCFIFLVGFRFGLRPFEALFLRQCDVYFSAKRLVLEVVPHRARRLKNTGSRRVLELLEPLSKLESDLLDRLFSQLDDRQAALRLPLFEGIRLPSPESFLRRLFETIGAEVRAVTGNPKFTYYHLRHGHLNRVSATVFDLEGPVWASQKLRTGCAAVRTALLGRISGVNRRTALGVGRYFGHVVARTSLRSYNHLLTDMLDEQLGLIEASDLILEHAIDVDALPFLNIQPTDWRALHAAPRAKVSYVNLIECLEHLGRGHSIVSALQTVNLLSACGPIIEQTIKEIEAGLWFSQTKGPHIRGSEEPFILLKRVSAHHWSQLRAAAQRWEKHQSGVLSSAEEVQLVRMIGPQRQLLLKSETDFQLMRHVQEVFQLPLSSFKVVIRGEDEAVAERVNRFGWEHCLLSDEEAQSITVGSYRVPGDQYERQYAVLVYAGEKSSPVPNRSMLVIALCVVYLAVKLGVENVK